MGPQVPDPDLTRSRGSCSRCRRRRCCPLTGTRRSAPPRQGQSSPGQCSGSAAQPGIEPTFCHHGDVSEEYVCVCVRVCMCACVCVHVCVRVYRFKKSELNLLQRFQGWAVLPNHPASKFACVHALRQTRPLCSNSHRCLICYSGSSGQTELTLLLGAVSRPFHPETDVARHLILRYSGHFVTPLHRAGRAW